MEVLSALMPGRAESPARHAAARRIQARARGKHTRSSTVTCPICFKLSHAFTFPAGCGHVTCERCADRWLERSRCCPLCRAVAPGSFPKGAGPRADRGERFVGEGERPARVRIAVSGSAADLERSLMLSREEFIERMINHPEEFALMRLRYLGRIPGDNEPPSPAHADAFGRRAPDDLPPRRRASAPAPGTNRSSLGPNGRAATTERPRRRSSLAKMGDSLRRAAISTPRRFSAPVVSAMSTLGGFLEEMYDGLVSPMSSPSRDRHIEPPRDAGGRVMVEF